MRFICYEFLFFFAVHSPTMTVLDSNLQEPVMSQKLIKGLGMSLAGLTLSFSVSANEAVVDPWQGFNRPVYEFNKRADQYVLKPLAQGYQAVTPDLVEAGVHNFFSNLGDVTSLLNSLLQLKGEAAAKEFARIVFNSTFGLAGIIDVATPMGLPSADEDFGQTLGYWGVPSGPYVVLPFFGPSSVRDAVGRVPDTYSDVWKIEVGHIPSRNVGYGVRVLDQRVSLFALEPLITGDEYSFVRDAYLQQRNFAVKDGHMDAKFNKNDF